MPQTVASFIPNFWQPHLETDLELIKLHSSAGDDVCVYVCGGELPSCYGNMQHENDTCGSCMARRRNGFAMLGLDDVTLRNFVNLKDGDRETLQKYKGLRPRTIEELREISFEECYVGRAVFNELVSHIRDSEPNLEEHAEYVTQAIEAGVLVYLSFKNNFAARRPDRFYTFNGRFVVSNAAIAAAKVMAVPFGVHDRSFVMNKYTLILDHSLHSVNYWSSQAKLHWEQSADPESKKIEIGSEWFEQRARGEKQGWYSMVAGQKDSLPESFNPERTNVVIFNTSEFETVGLDEYALRFYTGQNEGIERIARDLLPSENIQIYLRVHPNLKGWDNPQTRGIAQLVDRYRNLHVIPSDSPISTYSLLHSCDVVLTFGSTMGVEAAFARVPSVLLGQSYYQALDCCHLPTSHLELLDLLRSETFRLSQEEQDKRRLGATKYGYFMATGGVPFKFFEQTDVFEMREKTSNRPIPYHSVAQLSTTVDELRGYNEALTTEVESLRKAHASAASAPFHRIRSLGSSVKSGFRRLL